MFSRIQFYRKHEHSGEYLRQDNYVFLCCLCSLCVGNVHVCGVGLKLNGFDVCPAVFVECITCCWTYKRVQTVPKASHRATKIEPTVAMIMFQSDSKRTLKLTRNSLS